jgi:hypothetical protein
MKEAKKTFGFLVIAAALASAAFYAQPERRTPAVFNDEGEVFYPQFTNHQAVRSIEVVDYDESTAAVRPLKVELRKTRWVVASNSDYPIDIGDRLVKTAGALMDLRKDQVRSDAAQDHAMYGVIDPLDMKVSSLQGRGKRVTLRDEKTNVLADFVLGKPVEGKPGWRYVRMPGQKRTYAVKTDADPSARFADWVNAGLLRMPSGNIRKVTITSYMLDSFTGAMAGLENVSLAQNNGEWKFESGEPIKADAAKAMAATLDSLKIVDARPKPAELAQDLRSGQIRLSLEAALALRQFGYFLTQSGRIVASNGEMTVEMANGVNYHIRFGDFAAGGIEAGKTSSSENHHLFVTTAWDSARASRYGETSGAGEKSSMDLNARFANWFYVISGADFQKLRLKKKDLTP